MLSLQGGDEMFTVQTEKIVQRPVPEVFAFVADLRNASQWQSSVEEVRRLTPGSLGVDTEHVLVRRVLGRRLESQVHNTEYVPNQHFALEADYGSFAGHVEYRFAPAHSDKSSGGDEEATQVICIMQFAMRGLARIAEPLLRRQIERESQQNYVRLAEILEK